LNTPLVFGGLVAWWVTSRSRDEKLNNARLSRGTLIASGFIAGGSLFGVANALLRYFDVNLSPYPGKALEFVGIRIGGPDIASSSAGEIVGLVMFILLFAYALWDSMRAKADD
jgi:hypothetical protein